MRTAADTAEFQDCATRYLTCFKLGNPSLEVQSKPCNTKKLRAMSNDELISQGNGFHETFGLEHVNTTSTMFSSSAKQLDEADDWLTG